MPLEYLPASNPKLKMSFLAPVPPKKPSFLQDTEVAQGVPVIAEAAPAAVAIGQMNATANDSAVEKVGTTAAETANADKALDGIKAVLGTSDSEEDENKSVDSSTKKILDKAQSFLGGGFEPSDDWTRMQWGSVRINAPHYYLGR